MRDAGAAGQQAKLARVRYVELALTVLAVVLAAVAATLAVTAAAAWIAVATTVGNCRGDRVCGGVAV